MSPIFPRLLRPLRACAAVVLLALLAGCVTGFPGSPGGYGGYPGGGYGQTQVAGTVRYFDPSSGRLVVADEGYSRRDLELQVDGSTRLFWQGREHPVAGLEPGDRIRAQVVDDGRWLRVRTVEVVQNVRDSGYGGYGGDPYGGAYGSGYGAALEGAIRYVDLSRRVIEVERGGYPARTERVYFDARTRFDYRGQPVRPEQLERGDVIRVQGRAVSGGWQADLVQVVADARSR